MGCLKRRFQDFGHRSEPVERGLRHRPATRRTQRFGVTTTRQMQGGDYENNSTYRIRLGRLLVSPGLSAATGGSCGGTAAERHHGSPPDARHRQDGAGRAGQHQRPMERVQLRCCGQFCEGVRSRGQQRTGLRTKQRRKLALRRTATVDLRRAKRWRDTDGDGCVPQRRQL